MNNFVRHHNIIVREDGTNHEVFKSVNAAKRESRKLQKSGSKVTVLK